MPTNTLTEADVQQVLNRCDELYVRKDDCNTKMNEDSSRFSRLETDIALTKDGVGVIKKVLWAVFVAILGLLASSIWGNLVK